MHLGFKNNKVTALIYLKCQVQDIIYRNAYMFNSINRESEVLPE